ncbi:MAG: 30S ribosomal protein S6 [Patescibacteria group bacterium]|nr:30S ribosomal protein S6 [Patescibacteria group bacterium]MCL5262114.1 30S ribosomal protein S6 [Patescibacteria group bacterium]
MDIEEKRKYEIALLAKDEQTALAVADLLAKQGAEIVVAPRPGLIKLAYKIMKEESAFFSFIDFNLVPETIASVEKALKLNKALLRFLIVTPPPAKAVAKSFGKKPVVESAEEARKTADDAPKESLSNEALEQKLEEILS